MEYCKLIESEVGSRTFTLRGMEVMLDRDLAELHQVETKVLNQVVKRNLKRFPEDFMFRLNDSEKQELVTNCDRFEKLKHASVNALAKKIMTLEQKNDKQFKEVFKRLDNLVTDTQETDEKIMGFIKPKK